MKKNKVMLVIMDGWGIGKDYPGNAIKLADTPVIDRLSMEYPYTEIKASGLDVGLPEGQMGNSEVGHLNIGSGRIVYQELTLISKEIEDNLFYSKEEFLQAIRLAKRNNKSLHLMGLVSHGGVHSHIDHLVALLELAKKEDFKSVYLHAFLDGRDVSPNAGKDDISYLLEKMDQIGVGKLSSIIGRYYAMDRDKRWDRVEKAYNALTLSEGEKTKNPVKSIEDKYLDGITDEFMTPLIVLDDKNQNASIQEGDSIIFFNFRPDRARQLTSAFVNDNFDGFNRIKKLNNFFITMTEYDETLENVEIAYKPRSIKNTFGDIISAHGLRQLRIAETEKYAHVTFFFNGGVEKPLENEKRILIPSPKVATYDLKPEMSAEEVKQSVLEEINKQSQDVIILNFANADMVGHSGIISAEIKAVETVDKAVGELVDACIRNNYEMLITADHGNGEQLIDYDTGEAFTAHTSNKVPLIYITDKNVKLRDGGRLSDLAPTMLEILDIEKPEEMTGNSLIKEI